MLVPELHFNTASEQMIKNLLNSKSNFTMSADRGDLMQACARIERYCDECGFTSRVYTKGRLLGSLVALPLTPFAAVATAVHNIATLNPDFEIARNIATNTVTVTYKK
ncbi:MAG: hypothetical protein LBJ64_05100 [Deltaproteobacteria bacterium]|jgi:hypothetical protein|nr:hypothetical protein [Deltaproteobacteria bacterium]